MGCCKTVYYCRAQSLNTYEMRIEWSLNTFLNTFLVALKYVLVALKYVLKYVFSGP